MRSLFIYNLRIWSTCARARVAVESAVLQKRADCSGRGQRSEQGCTTASEHRTVYCRESDRVSVCVLKLR